MFIWVSIILLACLMAQGVLLLYLQWIQVHHSTAKPHGYAIFVGNSAAEIEGTIRKLYRKASMQGVDIELIVVDFSSEDDTIQVLERLAQYYHLHYYTSEEWEAAIGSIERNQARESRLEVIDLRRSLKWTR